MAREDRRVGTLLIAPLVAFLAGASPVAPAALLLANQPPEVVERLRDEKVVVSGPQPRSGGGSSFVGYVVFDRSVDRVFELLRETSRQVEFRPDLDRIESVERQVDGTLDEHHVRILFTDLAYRLRYRFEPGERRISWHLDPGFENTLRRIEGRWDLEPLGPAQTLARFETSIEVGAALPAFLEDTVVGRTVPTALESCPRWVNADGGR